MSAINHLSTEVTGLDQPHNAKLMSLDNHSI